MKEISLETLLSLIEDQYHEVNRQKDEEFDGDWFNAYRIDPEATKAKYSDELKGMIEQLSGMRELYDTEWSERELNKMDKDIDLLIKLVQHDAVEECDEYREGFVEQRDVLIHKLTEEIKLPIDGLINIAPYGAWEKEDNSLDIEAVREDIKAVYVILNKYRSNGRIY